MNAPPTPPAETTPLPESVSSVPLGPAPSASALSTPHQDAFGSSSLPDPYQDSLAEIASAAEDGDYSRVIRLGELADLNPVNDQRPSRLIITAPLVLAYLIADDMPPALHALMRLPERTKDHPLAQALFNLLASVWEQKHANVYVRAEALYNQTLPDASLGPIVSLLVGVFLDVFRKRIFALISKAYTSINLFLAQTYLGLAQEPLIATARAHGWVYDATTQVLTPARKATGETGVASVPSSLETFNHITDSVAALEA